MNSNNPYLSIGKEETNIESLDNPYLKAADIEVLGQGRQPTLWERGKEAVTDFFRKEPGLGPLTPEDYEQIIRKKVQAF
jgi:hypothetical protein